MITTTLRRIREQGPCREGWNKLLTGLGKGEADDEPLPFARIVEINGLDDALWCCRVEPQHTKAWRLFTIWCARQVEHLISDPRLLAVLNVAERHANGQATDDELAVAWGNARGATSDLECDAVWTATWNAVCDALWFNAGYAVQVATWDACNELAYQAIRTAQKTKFLEIVGNCD